MMTLPTSNLTPGERKVYDLMVADVEAGIEPSWEMSIDIAERLGLSHISRIMSRLCESGHIEKVKRGVYRVQNGD